MAASDGVMIRTMGETRLDAMVSVGGSYYFQLGGQWGLHGDYNFLVSL